MIIDYEHVRTTFNIYYNNWFLLILSLNALEIKAEFSYAELQRMINF